MIRDTLLIIDDCELDLIIMNEIFKDLFCVECVSNAKEGLLFLKQNGERVCGILLDIYLERPREGFHVLYRLQTDPLTSDFPVVFITSDANEKTVRDSVKLGAVDFLAKPVNPHMARERVCRLIREAWPPNSTILDDMSKPLLEKGKEIFVQKDGEEPNQPPSELQKDQDLFELWYGKLQDFCRMKDGMNIEEHRQLGVITAILAKRYALLYPHLGVTQEDAKLIGLASVFCDIGLLAIPDSVIAEWEHQKGMETSMYYLHTKLGYELFTIEDNQSSLFRYAAEIALWHHKNIDGSGYPSEDKDITIPISAQLTRAALRIQHYLYYYRGYPDCIERLLRALKNEAGVIFGYDLYEIIVFESKSFQSMANSILDCDTVNKQ